MPKLIKQCRVCGGDFTVWPSAAERRNTCSKECYARWQATAKRGANNPHWKGGDLTTLCAHCGTIFQYTRDRIRAGRQVAYCSRACKDAHQMQRAYGTPIRPLFLTRSCLTCDKPFHVTPQSKSRFCSVECKGVGMRTKRGAGYYATCEHCGKEYWLPNNLRPKTFCCSPACMRQVRTVETTCTFCGKSFRKPRSHATYEHDFCSNEHRIYWLNGSRREPTQPERAMKALLDELGVAYDFQRPYGNYILDFALSDRKIDIEVDGEYWHRQRAEHDARRDNWMRLHGWQVVRIPSMTLDTPDAVRRQVLRHLELP